MTACASAASRSCAMGTGQAEARKQKADGTGCRARGTLEPIPIQKKNISIFSWKKKLENAISDSCVFENNAHLSGGRNCCFPFSLRSSPRSPRTQCWAMKTRCRPFEIIRNKRSFLLAQKLRCPARRLRDPTLYSGGKGGRRRSMEKDK